MLRCVPEVPQIFEAQHVSDPPPGFVGNTSKDVLSADARNFSEGFLRIADMLKDFEHYNQIERIGGEWQSLYIGGAQASACCSRTCNCYTLEVPVNAKSARASQSTQDLSLPASGVEHGLNANRAQHLAQSVKETLVGIADQRAGIGVLGLGWPQVGSRRRWVRGRHTMIGGLCAANTALIPAVPPADCNHALALRPEGA